jgi:hypothetical protein
MPTRGDVGDRHDGRSTLKARTSNNTKFNQLTGNLVVSISLTRSLRLEPVKRPQLKL